MYGDIIIMFYIRNWTIQIANLLYYIANLFYPLEYINWSKIAIKLIVNCIFLNENVWISRNISLKFVLKVRINDSPACG